MRASATANNPPQFTMTLTPWVVTAGQDVILQTVETIDLESDSITYSLKTAPSGVSVDTLTGNLTWSSAPYDIENLPAITLLASDGQTASLTLLPVLLCTCQQPSNVNGVCEGWLVYPWVGAQSLCANHYKGCYDWRYGKTATSATYRRQPVSVLTRCRYH
ncbi:PREDICTED: uncharacterized protein LOC106814018 [Priapulus caudatus]|uniref:Uncharacterized protein LOC106814018 n=1 Tax=Priapulus caudatus TaxID=37621 RepID=A0ABM1ENJ0_PRICU|nr:PREDICTED: uncharacterized protein LOC106814018 [Priapulus caudatus]